MFIQTAGYPLAVYRSVFCWVRSDSSSDSKPGGSREEATGEARRPLFGGKFSPPDNRERIEWHADYHAYFQMGTLYTLVAGLLNMFAIFDAACGPMAYGGELPLKEKDETEGEEVW